MDQDGFYLPISAISSIVSMLITSRQEIKKSKSFNSKIRFQAQIDAFNSKLYKTV